MAEPAESVDDGARRHAVIEALLDGPDIVQVIRLTIVENTGEKGLVVAGSVAMVNTLPTHILAHALSDAKRRVRSVVGDDAEVYLEPDLVRESGRQEPPTDMIVIRATD